MLKNNNKKEIELQEINSENEYLLKYKKKEINYVNYTNSIYKKLQSYIF